MNDNVKSITAAAVIIACLAFLGFLVHEKVDGSIVLALAVVPTLIAFFTRQPNKSDPPSGIVMVAGIATILASMVSCASAQAKALEAEALYREQGRACIRQYETDEQIEACRAKVRAEWGFVETATKDGGAR